MSEESISSNYDVITVVSTDSFLAHQHVAHLISGITVTKVAEEGQVYMLHGQLLEIAKDTVCIKISTYPVYMDLGEYWRLVQLRLSQKPSQRQSTQQNDPS